MGASSLRTEEFAAIAERVAAVSEELSNRIIRRIRDEIPDYAAADEGLVFGDALDLVRFNVNAFVAHLGTPIALAPDEVDQIRGAGARRARQGISLAAVSQAYHIVADELWATIRAYAPSDSEAEREGVLESAGYVLRHIRAVWTAYADAYVDEAEGVWGLRRDLLDAVLRGDGGRPETQRAARSLGLDLRDDYGVIVARRLDVDDVAGERRRLRTTLELARERVRTSAGSALVGVRERELVLLVPLPAKARTDDMRTAAEQLANLPAADELVIGVSRCHPSSAGVPIAYTEAREAIEIAQRTGRVGTAVLFDDVLLEHVVTSSIPANRALTDIITALRDYDERRSGQLVETLRAYVESGFNATHTATLLFVHPNTVAYRLQRVRELTGRDARRPDDLIQLCLALKLDHSA